MSDAWIRKQYLAMKKRLSQRPLRVLRSQIHKWGLFSSQYFAAHSLVIEYMGEVIRKKVADLREKEYEDTGIGSCYMFKIDEEIGRAVQQECRDRSRMPSSA
eukprot:TRINITY_DN47269_c0_g1_i1.p1 TRINITY_DN47269_c0_g1~~TRINITY_DN47269_c0_g1_i1.p1  ORF type:complete len:102 (-),score=22.27 TRINITY_DN47269_c0_g1_i1:10-315(-)